MKDWADRASLEILNQQVELGRLSRVDIPAIIRKHCPFAVERDTAYLRLPDDRARRELVSWLALDVPADARISVMRQAIEGEPKDGWATFTTGKTLYVMIAVGPEDVQLENQILLAMGVSPEGLKK